MHYSAVHVRSRKTGKAEVKVYGFATHPGEPPATVIEEWRRLQANPRIGEEYTHAQLVVDNIIRESYADLPHPEIEAERERRLRDEQAESKARENAERIERLRAEIAALEPFASPENVIAAAAEQARKAAAADEARVAAEAAAAEEARVAAEAAAAEEARLAAEAAAAEAAAAEAGGSPAPAPAPAPEPPSERKGRLQPAPVPPV